MAQAQSTLATGCVASLNADISALVQHECSSDLILRLQGTPVAYFPNTDCDLASVFSANNIIFDITLCEHSHVPQSSSCTHLTIYVRWRLGWPKLRLQQRRLPEHLCRYVHLAKCISRRQ